MEIYIKVKEKEILECNQQIEKLLKEDKSPVAKFQADMKDIINNHRNEYVGFCQYNNLCTGTMCSVMLFEKYYKIKQTEPIENKFAIGILENLKNDIKAQKSYVIRVDILLKKLDNIIGGLNGRNNK